MRNPPHSKKNTKNIHEEPTISTRTAPDQGTTAGNETITTKNRRRRHSSAAPNSKLRGKSSTTGANRTRTNHRSSSGHHRQQQNIHRRRDMEEGRSGSLIRRRPRRYSFEEKKERRDDDDDEPIKGNDYDDAFDQVEQRVRSLTGRGRSQSRGLLRGGLRDHHHNHNAAMSWTNGTTTITVSARRRQQQRGGDDHHVVDEDDWWRIPESRAELERNDDEGGGGGSGILGGAGLLVQRCIRVYGWSFEYACRVLAAYRQFIELKRVLQDWDDTCISPSAAVYAMWRQHYADVVGYCHDCSLLLGGRLLGHDPEAARTEYADRNHTTYMTLRARFGHQAIDEEIWSFEDDENTNLPSLLTYHGAAGTGTTGTGTVSTTMDHRHHQHHQHQHHFRNHHSSSNQISPSASTITGTADKRQSPEPPHAHLHPHHPQLTKPPSPLPSSYVVYVKTPTDRVLSFRVGPFTPLDRIKQAISQAEGLSVEHQMLFLAERRVQGGPSLQEAHVGPDSTLIVDVLPDKYQVIVKGMRFVAAMASATENDHEQQEQQQQQESTYFVDAYPNMTVKELKSAVELQTGMPLELQQLQRGKETLRDEQTLAQCCIGSLAKIEVQLMQRHHHHGNNNNNNGGGGGGKYSPAPSASSSLLSRDPD